MKKSNKRSKRISPAESISDRAWKTAHLAAILATRYPVPHGQPSHGVSVDGDSTLVRNEADPQLNKFYLSLLRRAQFLLANAEARTGEVHASQLFDSLRRYAIVEIARAFREAGWKNLTSENSVRALLTDIRKEIENRMTAEIVHFLRSGLDPGYFHPSKQRRSPSELDEIETQIVALQNDLDQVAGDNRIAPSIKEQISLVRSRQTMFKDITGSSDPENGYIAYALFDICADMGIAEEKLWRPRSELNPVFPL